LHRKLARDLDPLVSRRISHGAAAVTSHSDQDESARRAVRRQPCRVGIRRSGEGSCSWFAEPTPERTRAGQRHDRLEWAPRGAARWWTSTTYQPARKWSTDVRATLCYDLAPELAARRAARPLAIRPRDAQLLHVGKRAQRPTDSALIAGSARAPRVGPSYLDVTASELEGLPLRVNERTEGVALDSNEQSPMAR
jgi:hypothetical protein